MDYTITGEDLKIIQQNYIRITATAELLDSNFNVIGTIDGEIMNGSFNIEAESDVRRTCNISLNPTDAYDLNENSKVWLDKIIRLYLNYYYEDTNSFKSYCFGTLVVTDGNFTYDATNNLLTINLQDLTCTLDGTMNGEIGAWEYEISYGWVISTVMKSIVTQFGGIKNFSIDEMGMYYGIDYYIDKFEQDYVVDEVLLDIIKNAATEARTYETTEVFDNATIRKNSINEVLEEVYNEYQNLDKNGINFTFTKYDQFQYGYDYSVVNGELVLTPNGDIPPIGGAAIYDLFNCPELLSYVGNTGLYVYDKYNNLRNIEIIMINSLVCVSMGEVYGWWMSTPKDNTLIRLSDIVLSSKSLTAYKKSAFITDSTYQKLVSAFKYLIEIPYKISLSSGGNVLGLITEIRDLYPAWETFFDPYGIFKCQMIPTCEGDKIVLDEKVMDSLVISEGRSFSYTDIKNVIHVFGKTFTINNYATDCTYVSQLYTATLANYNSYTDGTYICVKIPTTNTVGDKLRINALTAYDIYDMTTNDLIPSKTLIGGQSYVFQYSSLGKMYLLGQYQASALVKLVSTMPDANEKLDDMAKYNCKNIKYVVNPDSQYTVEKIGEHKKVFSGDDMDSVYSDSLAMSTAEYKLWYHTRLNDNITITTLPIPFLDVNQKIKYRLQKTGEVYEYIIKSISLSVSETEPTMTITMMRYYNLYPDIVTT